MNHISSALAAAVDEDRVAPPPPPPHVLSLEIEGFELGIKVLEKQGKKGEQTAILWMEIMTRKDQYRLATGKGHEDPVDVSRVERIALIKLFENLKGFEWNKKFGWLGLLKSVSRPEILEFDARCSHFEGVETVKLMSTAMVSGLRFPGVGAYGVLPKQIGDFESLRLIDMNWNLISGGLPREIAALSGLETLHLAGNQLSGEIDEASLSELTNLKSLDLSNNRFKGIIPDAFKGMSGLRMLDLSNNRLSGNLPRSLASCIKLEVLKIFCNQLSGELSSAIFFPLVKLRDVNLSQNGFQGCGLDSFVSCTALERLQLQENDLTGHLNPQLLRSLPNLQILYLHKNRLGGFIPSEISMLTKLRRLNLSSNFFRGSLPEEIGLLTSLETLLIEDNEIIAPLPRSLSKLVNMREYFVVKNYPSEHMNINRGFNKEDFERVFVDGPNMELNSACFEHESMYSDTPKEIHEQRFELFERRLYKQRGLPYALGKIS